ncbi:MAG: amidophosphoribosyltransferase, partial [Firmicutes bacterium]|nr:amidophosphoribosyltransferase [Bacillota bacterium]
TYWGTFSLQHRGQESAGIAVLSPERKILVNKGMGLVTEALNVREEKDRIGTAALGHVRYSTTGESSIANAQPLLMHTRFGVLAIGQNGNVVNAGILRKNLQRMGAVFQSTTDSEVLGHLVAKSTAATLKEALLESLPLLQGGFAFTVLSDEGLYGARDPHGIRPLVLGRTDQKAGVLASETCALDAIGAQTVREVDPGELVLVNDAGVDSTFYVDKDKRPKRALCAFEVIYFARPDSVMDGQSMHSGRRRLGQMLAEEAPAQADVVVGVPDSSLPAAMGFAEASGLPFDFGLVKNRYIARTFIAPNQTQREASVSLKVSAVKEVVAGKRVVLVDDSLVRGTTSRRIVQLLREAGAKEVHMRISSPPYTDPCYYGIDTSRAAELMARARSIEDITRQVGADSLAYLSVAGLEKALGPHGWCTACFGAGYPVPIPESEDEER